MEPRRGDIYLNMANNNNMEQFREGYRRERELCPRADASSSPRWA